MSVNKPSETITYFLKRDEVFSQLPNDSSEIIMLGNSLTHNFEWNEIFNDVNIKNRGINGDITMGVLQRLDEVLESNPLKIFIEIGINDIQQGIAQEEILKNYNAIIEKIQLNSPETKIYIQSILPSSIRLYGNGKTTPEYIKELNTELKSYCKTQNITYIDLFSAFENKGKLNVKYDIGDELHLNGAGYLLWCQIIEKHIYE